AASAALMLTAPSSAAVAQEDGADGGAAEEDDGAMGAHASAPRLRAAAVDDGSAIEIDGRLDESAWARAAVATEFIQNDPDEGEPATERTEVRVIYTPDALIIGATMHDSHPISSRLGRRDDDMNDSDWFSVALDSYHDHRTAFEFRVNPAGVRGDAVVSGGTNRFDRGDESWDPVWQVATSVIDDGHGWVAEMRIPFSQLRFSDADVQTWGVQFQREISRNNEESVFAFTPTSERGGVARYGHLVGLRGLEPGNPIEVLPYIVSRAEYRRIAQSDDVAFENPYRDGSDYFTGIGADLKYRVTSNLTLDATINPDFGQVEVDPAVVNLSAFETRFDEKRPFFVEGAEIFRFGGGGGGGGPGGGGGTQLFYSRRIGARPYGEAPSEAAYADIPDATTIVGAGKLTGRTASGWSIGVLEAVTAREYAPYTAVDGGEGEAMIEPLTNYVVGRLERQLRQGQTVVGGIVTAVNRDLADTPLLTELRSSAYTGGIDFSHEWADRAWSLSGYFAGSHISGEPAVIEAAQRSSARYYQRPDADHLSVDPDATALRGYAAEVELEKQAGLHWRGDLGLSATSPGYEVNDLGFQSRADHIRVEGQIEYVDFQPGRFFRDWNIDFGPELTWSYGGDLLERGVSVGGFGVLRNYWGGHFGYSRDLEGLDVRRTRGGPLTVRPASDRINFRIFSDRRKPWTFSVGGNASGDEADGSRRSVDVRFGFKPASNWTVSLGPRYSVQHDPAQYITQVEDPTATETFGRRYIFAPLDRTTLNMDVRLNVAFSADVTLELYAQPFIASGDFGAPRQLGAPRTFEFDSFGADGIGRIDAEDDGWRIDPDGDGPAESFFIDESDFNVRSLRGNAVLRWQWRPGSTLFLVWQQERSADAFAAGDFDFDRDARALFGAEPDNVLVVKMNYWFTP
ncbi:MAG: DUF5916 domain-containing protein, partial [Gemmatimonadota bacterium]